MIYILITGIFFQLYVQSDVDFQENTNHINVFWKGFSDPHSDIHFYRVGIGSSPFYDDIEPMMDIALRTGRCILVRLEHLQNICLQYYNSMK